MQDALDKVQVPNNAMVLCPATHARTYAREVSHESRGNKAAIDGKSQQQVSTHASKKASVAAATATCIPARGAVERSEQRYADEASATGVRYELVQEQCRGGLHAREIKHHAAHAGAKTRESGNDAAMQERKGGPEQRVPPKRVAAGVCGCTASVTHTKLIAGTR